MKTSRYFQEKTQKIIIKNSPIRSRKSPLPHTLTITSCSLRYRVITQIYSIQIEKLRSTKYACKICKKYLKNIYKQFKLETHWDRIMRKANTPVFTFFFLIFGVLQSKYQGRILDSQISRMG